MWILSYSRSPECKNSIIFSSNFPTRVMLRLGSPSFEISYANKNDYILEPELTMWKVSNGCSWNLLRTMIRIIRVYEDHGANYDDEAGCNIIWVDNAHN